MKPSDKNFSGRYLVILVAALGFWALIVGRLYMIQVVQGEEYRQIGKSQVENREPIPAIRGNLYDRNQRALTMNIPQYSFGAHPDKVQNKTGLASRFAVAFGSTQSYYLGKLNSSQPFLWLERNIEKQKIEPLLEYDDPGLVVEMQSTRYYPYREIGAQVIGATNVDGRGITGLEAQYDSLLQGKPGWTILKANGRGVSMPSPKYPSIDPIHGHDLELTLDLEYQTIVEEALSQGLKEYEASAGTAVLMNPSTGAILAMTSLPSYDANSPGEARSVNMKNRAVTDVYEPGSTMKIVTATAALAENIARPEDVFFCENGEFMRNGKIIQDWDSFGDLTFSQVIANSSNIGTIKIAEELGSDLLYQYLRRFGFGNKTGVNFIGEVSGILHPLTAWSDMSLPSISIGYEISVTALQMANAFAAIANDGYLMQPYMVKRIIDQHGKTIYNGRPEVIRQVAPRKVIREVRSMLELTVEEGTGSAAQINGIKVAGKTGTAQKFIDGEYSDTQYYSSFVGFFPAQNPKLLCAVILDSPAFGKHWGGHAAAPIVKSIFSNIINSTDDYYVREDNLPTTTPENDEAPNTTQPIGAPRNEPVLLTTQMFAAPMPNVETVAEDPDPLRMPDVRGMSLRNSLVKLYDLGLEVRIAGYGEVVKQSPAPGTHVEPGTICKLQLKNE